MYKWKKEEGFNTEGKRNSLYKFCEYRKMKEKERSREREHKRNEVNKRET